MKTQAVQIDEHGGPEKLVWREIDLAPPAAGELLLRQTAVGVNFIDTYHRSGMYPLSLPSGLGLEAAAVVEAVGPDVEGFEVGDRVGYVSGPIGAYAERRVFPAAKAIKLPDAIDDRTAAGMMLQGMTAEYLIRRTYKVKEGDQVLFHAAAGGVGLIACQWLASLGATVIGTAGSDEKAELARAHGCQYVINYRHRSFAHRVHELTGGLGVDVVYDGVGRDTFQGSLACLRPRGMMVSFGNASGQPDPIAPSVLSSRGSLFLTRPTLGNYIATRPELLESADALFDVVQRGVVKPRIGQSWALEDAANAHKALEARTTTGSVVLIP